MYLYKNDKFDKFNKFIILLKITLKNAIVRSTSFQIILGVLSILLIITLKSIN